VNNNNIQGNNNSGPHIAEIDEQDGAGERGEPDEDDDDEDEEEMDNGAHQNGGHPNTIGMNMQQQLQ
jgi:hypothetical protein